MAVAEAASDDDTEEVVVDLVGVETEVVRVVGRRVVSAVNPDIGGVVGSRVVSVVKSVLGRFVGRRLVIGKFVGRRLVRGRLVGRRSGIREAIFRMFWGVTSRWGCSHLILQQ